MMQEKITTDQEKMQMYMMCSQKVLAEMLIEANKTIRRLASESNDIHNVSETYTADQMRKMFFAGLFHDSLVDESEDGEVYESAYNDVMSRTKSSSR